MPIAWNAITGTCRTSSSPWSGANCTFCRPIGEADRPRRRQDRRGHDKGGHDRQEDGPVEGGARPTESAFAPAHRSRSPRLDVLAKGLPASPGAASGKVVFDADTAERLARDGEKVILVRPETTPEDIHGMLAAQGILHQPGRHDQPRGGGGPRHGKTVHLRLRRTPHRLAQKGVPRRETVIREGDLLLHRRRNRTGDPRRGAPDRSGAFRRVSGNPFRADEVRTLKVRANADNPEDAAKARRFGAEGIGLCRTEHMFMEASRVPIVQEMILAETPEQRRSGPEQAASDAVGGF